MQGRQQHLVQRRRGDSGSGGVTLTSTGGLDWEVRCVRSADDGDDAMPSTSANTITSGSGTAGESLPACLQLHRTLFVMQEILVLIHHWDCSSLFCFVWIAYKKFTLEKCCYKF